MADQRTKGLLITIEGIDGCGKSSAAKALHAYLSKTHDAVLTKEPGATALGLHLRSLLQERTSPVSPQAELLLFAADRAQHMHEVVLPALKSGKIVISDRMADSSRAYQGFGRGLDDEWIDRLSTWAMESIVPDLTVYLKIDYPTAQARLQKRNEAATAFEQERAAFFERVILGFETIFKERSSVITIDATQPIDTVEATLFKQVEQFVSQARLTL